MERMSRESHTEANFGQSSHPCELHQVLAAVDHVLVQQVAENSLVGLLRGQY